MSKKQQNNEKNKSAFVSVIPISFLFDTIDILSKLLSVQQLGCHKQWKDFVLFL